MMNGGRPLPQRKRAGAECRHGCASCVNMESSFRSRSGKADPVGVDDVIDAAAAAWSARRVAAGKARRFTGESAQRIRADAPSRFGPERPSRTPAIFKMHRAGPSHQHCVFNLQNETHPRWSHHAECARRLTDDSLSLHIHLHRMHERAVFDYRGDASGGDASLQRVSTAGGDSEPEFGSLVRDRLQERAEHILLCADADAAAVVVEWSGPGPVSVTLRDADDDTSAYAAAALGALEAPTDTPAGRIVHVVSR